MLIYGDNVFFGKVLEFNFSECVFFGRVERFWMMGGEDVLEFVCV